MKKLIIALALLFASLGIAGTANATARWQNFGADKAYASREAALSDANAVMKRAGWPEEVRRLMLQKMQQRGTTVRLTNGMHLDFMRSGSSDLWVNVLVDFKKPPSKDAGNMEYSAPAEEWEVEWGGRLWRFGRPEVCNNLYGIVVPIPPIKTSDEECVYHDLEIKKSGYLRAAFLGPYGPSKCGPAIRGPLQGFGGKQDSASMVWTPFPTSCPDRACNFIEVARAAKMNITQSGGLAVTPGHYVVRLPKIFAESKSVMTVYCLAEIVGADLLHSCGIDVYASDHHDGLATIFYGESDIPTTWRWRKLWWVRPNADGVCPAG